MKELKQESLKDAATEVIKEFTHEVIKSDNSTLTLLMGEAPEEILPCKIDITGNIKSVGAFLSKRFSNAAGCQCVDKGKAVVIVDEEDRIIRLYLDPEYKYGTIITGRLELYQDLKQFSINENKMFSKEEFVRLIKYSKFYFPDASEHAELLKAFMTIKSSVSIHASDSSDERGNKAREFVKSVESNAPQHFHLKIPIYKGFADEIFKVNICIDAPEGNLKFWLESVELIELMKIRMKEIFEEELKYAKDLVIIHR